MAERKTTPRQNAGGRAIHDVGGLKAGTIDRAEHELTLYEKRVDAILMLLAGPKNAAFRVDALRRTIEDYTEQEYDNTAYYDRWMRAIRNLVVEQELLTGQEVDDRIAEICDRLEAAGQQVSRKVVP